MPKWSRRTKRSFRAFVAKQIQLLNPLPYEDEELLFENWMCHSHYNLKRQAVLREKFQTYRSAGGYLNREDFNCKMFVKREFYEEQKHARLIISRSDAFKAAVGGVIHELEEYIYKESPIARYFVKGTNPCMYSDLMKKITEKYQNIIETDYSSFESSFSPSYQKCCELALFKHMLKNFPNVYRLIEKTYEKDFWVELDEDGNERQFMVKHPKWIVSHNHRMVVDGNRKSGEMWTSLANGFSNLMNMMYLCHTKNIDFDGFVEGDDGFFGVSKCDIHPEDYRKLGFNIKLEYVTDINDTSFCGIKVSESGKQLVNPELLNRVGWTNDKRHFHMNQKHRQELYKSKVMSSYCLSRHTPVVGPILYSIFKTMMNVKQNRKYCDWWESKFEWTFEPPDIDMGCRVTFEKLYGISLREQLELEEYYARNPQDHFDIDFGYVSNIGNLDWGTPGAILRSGQLLNL